MALFGGNKEKTPVANNNKNDKLESGVSIIAAGMTIIGDVESNGNIRIEGKLIGKLICRARVSVGAKGKIEGSIDSSNAHIEGEVNGTVMVRELLQLQETGRVNGDITTVRLAVQDGAVFTGNIRMGKEAKEFLQNSPAPTLLNDTARLNSVAQNAANQNNINKDKAKTLS